MTTTEPTTGIILPDNPNQVYRLTKITTASGQVLHQGGIFTMVFTVPKGYALSEEEVHIAYGVTPADSKKFKHFSMANKQDRHILKPVEGAVENKHIRHGKCYALYESYRGFLRHLGDDSEPIAMAPVKTAPPPSTEPTTFTPYTSTESVVAVMAVGQRWKTNIRHGTSDEVVHIRIGTMSPGGANGAGTCTCEYGAMVQGELAWCPSDHQVTYNGFALVIVNGKGGMLS